MTVNYVRLLAELLNSQPTAVAPLRYAKKLKLSRAHMFAIANIRR